MFRYTFLTLALGALLLTGCNTLSGQPSITRAGINPELLEPGTSAVITLAIKDKQEIVKRIEGIVLEDPRITFPLRDDGQPPDEKADDNVWSMQVDVPFQAPPGAFSLEFTHTTGRHADFHSRQARTGNRTETDHTNQHSVPAKMICPCAVSPF